MNSTQQKLLSATHVGTTLISLCSLMWMQIASAEDPGPIVPMEQTSFHVPAMHNEYVTVLMIDIPGNSMSEYHIHDHDQACVTIDEYPPEAYSQPLGGPPGPPRRPARGEVSFLTYVGKPITHRAVNPGTLAMHSVCNQLISPKPYGFTPAAREVPGYQQVLDNERVRAWRLSLAPGQMAPTIKQNAPGERVVIRGGKIEEILADKRARGMVVREGQFFWQDAGAIRAVRNVGTTPVELVEFEFK